MDELTRLALAARDTRHDGAVEAFVRATQSDVWRLCAHLGDPEHADDLAQEVYARALRALPSYRADSPVRPWLFSIVRRVVSDDIAARQRRRSLLSRRTGQAETSGRHEVPDHQGEVVLQHLLAALDEDRRRAFVLTQVLGYSYAEAAEAVGCPIGTIRSRVARAREDLMEMVDPAVLQQTRPA